eukprot:m.423265 g.423265  ORF g.423265 m.423265 type:complete len:407 (+) comp21331_c0_seq2:156-1376(+)
METGMFTGSDKSEWICEAIGAIELKLVQEEEDIEKDDLGFAPEFTHQIIGQSETIYGYKNPKLKLYYTAATLKAYMAFEYSEVVSSSGASGAVEVAAPDDVQQLVGEWLDHAWMTSRDVFASHLAAEEAFEPVGELIHQYTRDAGGVTYEIYTGNAETPGLLDYHKRVQTFFVWFIEAAQYFSDIEDERRQFYYLYQNRQGRRAFVGAATVYNYYAWWDKVRPRISQFLILPPYQKQGHAGELLNAIYNKCKSLFTEAELAGIAVEDPAEGFVRLRDKVDVQRCWEALPDAALYQQPFSPAVDAAIHAVLHTGKAQTRRVFEMLQLHTLPPDDRAARDRYRLAVKRRLVQPHLAQQLKDPKLQAQLTPEEFNNILTERRKIPNDLQTSYTQLIDQYRDVLFRAGLR